MNYETRVFFKLPANHSLAPSLTHREMAQLVGQGIQGGIDPLSSEFPEKRTDNYLVIGGLFGGLVGVKLRNQRERSSSSKLEVKTCISRPITKEELKEEKSGTEALPVSAPSLAAWDKVSTKIKGSVDDNLDKVSKLILLGGRGRSDVGTHAAKKLVFNPQNNKLVQIVLAKKRIQGFGDSFAFEETDVQVSLINGPSNLQRSGIETWRSWAFEGGSHDSLEPIAENWEAIFKKAVSSMHSTNAPSTDNDVPMMLDSFRVASYPEFVQSIHLDRLQQSKNLQSREGLHRAEPHIRGRTVAHGLSADGVLLVSEGQRGLGEASMVESTCRL
ncbi:expressed unknown protein [Seminavis robusta]|uniref:Uncharacterized protein n=1 Tax=Seminavis robusta TaxID=568900 RepID=A0A9N8H660_9STRA|nr:expressed unknown protein [Seminavis robusta]|eukprot:Sro103_g052551.1  (330) ;mRNA; r:78037-79026